jgi:hypothetical protein
MSAEHDDLDMAWSHVLHAYADSRNNAGSFEQATHDFLKVPGDHVQILKQALTAPGVHRKAALKLIEQLDEVAQRQFLGELVFLASWAHGSTSFVRRMIADYPRAWVKRNIEQFAEPILQHGDEEAYRRILELYHDLDHDMEFQLARRAVQHNNPLIQEVGREFLE